jgi:hypothetical protein
MAIGNGYTKYIKNNLTKFIVETIAYGLIGTIPVLYMERYRKSTNHNYFILFISTFFLYVGINLLLELSGIYYFLYEKQQSIISLSLQPQKNLTEDQKIINNSIYSVFITIGIVMLFFIISMVIIAIKISDFNIEAYEGHLMSSFALEIFIFSLLNSVPFFLIAYNREGKKFDFKKNCIEVGLLFLKFVILHILLQASGFFKQNLGY